MRFFDLRFRCLFLAGAFLFLCRLAQAVAPLEYSGGVWKKATYSCVIRSIIEDPKGNLWIGTFGAGLWKYDGRSVASIPADPSGIPDPRMSKLLLDKGRVLVATAGGGAAAYDPRKKKWAPLSGAFKLASAHFHAFNHLADGTFLLGSVGEGVLIGKDSHWLQLTESEGLTNDWVNDALELPEGILLATSQGLSLVRDGRVVDAFLPTSGWADGNINALCRFQSRIFLGHASSGLSALTFAPLSANGASGKKALAGRQKPIFEQIPGMPAQIHAFQEFEGSLYVASEVGLYAITPDLKTDKVPGKWPSDCAIKALGLYKSELVVGTADGEVYIGRPSGEWRRIFAHAEFIPRGGSDR